MVLHRSPFQFFIEWHIDNPQSNGPWPHGYELIFFTNSAMGRGNRPGISANGGDRPKDMTTTQEK